jgi:hypothetical protein
MAVGLSTVVHGIGSRRDIERNLQIVEDGIHAAVSIVGINMPVRLIALAEGALTGFTDEIFDIPHVTAARDLFVDIPGPETDRLASLARQYEHRPAHRPGKLYTTRAGLSRSAVHRARGIPRRGRLGTRPEPVGCAAGRIAVVTHP